MSKQGCKGCSASVHLSVEDIYEVIKGAVANLQEDLVEEDVYRMRLEICQKCPELLYNTTCKYSGYIVYVLARDKKASCQHPGQQMW